MKIDSIQNGYVIDHIKPGMGMELYNVLRLDKLTCSVALLKNVPSGKMGKKDIIKIDELIDLNFDVIGYMDPGITVNIVKNGVLTEKRKPEMPREIRGVIRCNNPRCISSVEQELLQVFRLTDRENRVYRCLYCDAVSPRKRG